MVVGYLNTNIVETEANGIDEAIAEALSDTGMEEVSGHFLLTHSSWVRYVRTWSMIR